MTLCKTRGTGYGICECGCGLKTRTDPKIGAPNRFIVGHRYRRYEDGHTVEDHGYETPCWIHAGLISKNGYGMATNFSRFSGSRLAHVHAWEEAYGPITDGLTLDHLCRVRACRRPDHLEEATMASNVHRGNRTKLDKETVEEIRRIYRETRRYQYELAKDFGVVQATISDIVNNRTWREESKPYPRNREVHRKLGQDDVDEIRRLAEEEGLGTRKLSERYPVSRMQISNILRNKSWVTDDPEQTWGNR